MLAGFPGLAFREAMRGTYWRLDAPTDVMAIAVSLEARTPDLAALLGDRFLAVRGSIDADRLATAQPLEGTLAFRFAREGRLHYRLAFTGDDGQRYELGGQKEWSAFAPLDSLSVLTASVYDVSSEPNVEVGHGTLRFEAGSGIWSIVKSLRFAP